MKDEDREALGFEGAKILLHRLRDYQNKGKHPTITYGEMAEKLGSSKDFSRVVDSCFGKVDEISKDQLKCIFTTLIVNADTGMSGPGYYSWHFSHVKNRDEIQIWNEEFNKIINGNIDWDSVDEELFNPINR